MSVQPWRIVVRKHGGPEVLEREEFNLPEPGPGQVRLRISAIGLNFIDTYHRSGIYKLRLPSGLGVEAAGMIEAVGPDVVGWAIGDRVGSASEYPGTYATHMIGRADRLVRIPDSITDDVAAAILLKGLTCWMLVERCAKIQAGQTVLVHSAAGGVGSLLVPWLKAAGATIIAHAGNSEKAAAAAHAGAHHALSCPFDALAPAVRDLTSGRGVDVVFDGVGADSWSASLASVARRGLIVSYGNASGPVPPVAPLDLLNAGSIFLTRPGVFYYLDTPEMRAEGASRLFSMVASGAIVPPPINVFPLEDAADVHRALESRQTTGPVILRP